MPGTKDQIRQQLAKAAKDGDALLRTLAAGSDELVFGLEYQRWYTQTLSLVKTLAPDRLEDLRNEYEVDPKRRGVTITSYVLKDFVKGLRSAPNALGELAFDHLTVATLAM